ncbi:MAG: outer membrane beta-barrel protein [Deltaproteobacteria bacterium]|nr:outer membrane beta-barrel protein [bacterium]MCB9476999.1 outer membrane beta-barrel protein [Deltaproteobacteria bacterium]MCB9490142.1 outer membrane beta-barrel protein [Deltaproteobacteria bacterium]
MRRTLNIAAIIGATLTILFAMAVPAWAGKTEARCGWEVGGGLGPAFPTDSEIRDEFPFLYELQVDFKRYLFWYFSLGAQVGYQFGEGNPKGVTLDGEAIVFDNRGYSYWRAAPVFAVLRFEPFRYREFAPYVGFGGGFKYLVLERSGKERTIPRANSGDAFLWGTALSAGFDYELNKFFFLRLEGRWDATPTADDSEEIFEAKDFSTAGGYVGVNVYF